MLSADFPIIPPAFPNGIMMDDFDNAGFATKV